MLRAARGLIERDERGGGGDGIGDSDNRLLRNDLVSLARDGEKGGPDKGHPEREKVSRRIVKIVTEEECDRRAQGGQLRQGEVDKDHPAPDDMDTEIGMHPGQDQAGQQGPEQKGNHRTPDG